MTSTGQADSKYRDVNALLKDFDYHQADVDADKQVVTAFLETFEERLRHLKGFLAFGSKFRLTGSSYERTVVSHKTDYDVAMILAFPLGGFRMIRTDEPGLYNLQLWDKYPPTSYQPFFNGDHILKVNEFRERIFWEMKAVLSELNRYSQNEIIFTHLVSVVRVVYKCKNHYFKLDIAPQILVPCTSELLTGWNENAISGGISMRDEDKYVTFNVSFPPGLKGNHTNYILQACFSILENEIMLQSRVVRNSVRLAKAVAKRRKWFQKGLRSFHLKRIAISIYDQIESSKDPWEGFSMILEKLASNLEMKGKIDGIFLENQDVFKKTKEVCCSLAKDVTYVLSIIKPHNIALYLDFLSIKQ